MADHLATVRPELAAKARKIEASAAKMGIRIIWTSGLRTEAEQAALYAQGRTKPGRIVTQAKDARSSAQGRTKPGRIVTQAKDARSSAHGRGAALDFAVLNRDGRPTWDPPYWHVYEVVGRLAEAEGLAWGGRFLHMDMPHLQLADWKSLPEVYP